MTHGKNEAVEKDDPYLLKRLLLYKSKGHVKRPHGRIGVVKKQCPNFFKEILKP